jgi:hypothetical protein
VSIDRQRMNGAIEVVVVADTNGMVDRHRLDRLRDEIESAKACRWLEHDGGIHCYGQPQRSYGAREAAGDWVAFSQDDNILAEHALSAIWTAVCQESCQRPLFFRAQMHWGDFVWHNQQLYQSNIDADCLVLPRHIAREVQWGLRYEGDFDAAVHAMQLADGNVGWREEVIAIARPEAEQIWWD